MKIKHLFLSLSLLAAMRAKGQNTSNQPTVQLRTDLIGPSPTVQSLGKFGIIPVSYSTGIPDISIDMGAATGKELSLPISLNYHHNGLKSFEKASWVGLGWSLNAGGVITRIIRDKVDETTSTQYQYDQNASQFQISGQLDQDFLDGALHYATYDTEPDLFSYTFGKYSGTFMFYNGAIYQYPEQKLKITGTTSAGFTITTDEGTVYNFSTTEMTLPKNMSVGGYTLPNHISSWYLSSVNSADQKESIQLHYSGAEEVLMHGPSSQSYMKIIAGGINDILNPTQISGAPTIQAIRLTDITTSTGLSVTFIPQTTKRNDLDGTGYALDKVTFSGNNGIVKAYKFNYDYFNNGGGVGSALKLTSLNRLGNMLSMDQAQTHYFWYNENGTVALNSNGVDHWGYVNGSSGNILIPNTVYSGGSNREPNMSYSSFALLNRITYPTGGETVFEFEPNDYFTSQENQAIPRNIDINLTRPSGSESSNTLLSETQQFTIATSQTVTVSYSRVPKVPVVAGDPNNGPDAPTKDTEPEVIITTTPDNPSYKINYNRDNGGLTAQLSLAPGTYSITVQCDAKELSVHGAVAWSEENNGSSVVSATGPGLRIRTITSYTGKAGSSLVAFKRQYSYKDSLGFSTGTLLKGLDYGGDYDYLDRDYSRGPADNIDKVYRIYHSSINSALGDLVDQQMWYRQVTEDEIGDSGTLRSRYSYTTFDNGNDYTKTGILPVETVKYKLVNGNYQQVSRQTTEYGVAFANTIFMGMKPFQNKQVSGSTSERLRAYDVKWYSLLPGAWVFKKKETNAFVENNVAVTTYNRYHNDVSNHLLASSNQTTSNGRELVTKYKYPENYADGVLPNMLAQHVLAPIIEMQTWVKRSDADSILTGGKITEFDYNLFKPKTEYYFESPGATALAQENKNGDGSYSTLISDNTKYVSRISYQYDAASGRTLQVMPITIPSPLMGIPTTYLWSYNNQYPVAEIRNADLTSVNNALSSLSMSASTIGVMASVTATQLSTIRTAIRNLLPNAQIVTYTYDPLVGMTSMTDPKGITTTYEYDSFQRLMNVKDKDGNIIKHMDYHYQGQ